MSSTYLQQAPTKSRTKLPTSSPYLDQVPNYLPTFLHWETVYQYWFEEICFKMCHYRPLSSFFVFSKQ